jgi:hypothetical protein
MRKSLIGLSALGVLCFATPTFAGFAISATGNVPAGTGLVSPPADVASSTSSSYQIWNEQQGTLASSVTLTSGPTPDGTTVSGVGPFTPTTLAAGTAFGTTYVQLNTGSPGAVSGGSGTATILFSSRIIGLSLSASNLTATNVFGAPGTTYPSGGDPNNNGGSIVGKSNQFFTITDGGRELEVQLTSQFLGFKDIRVFTAGNSTTVPEPASLIVWSLLGTVVSGGAWWRRQRPAV